MLSIRDRRRTKLFQLYSQNLQFLKRYYGIRFEPDFDEGYICPLCFKVFFLDALSEKYLTLEDIPPAKLGGKPRILTCQNCNHWSGTNLDSELINKLAFDDFLQGISSATADGRVRFGEEYQVGATIRIGEKGQIQILYDPRRSNQLHIDETRRMLKAGAANEINLTLYGKYKQNRPEVALLRIAYLLAFNVLGYGFLLNDNMQEVRRQILAPEEKTLPHWGLSTDVDLPDSWLGINIIHKPVETKCFFIVFDLKTENRVTRNGVVLPGPRPTNLDVYNNIAAISREEKTTYTAFNIPNESYLTKPDAAFAARDMWDELTGYRN